MLPGMMGARGLMGGAQVRKTVFITSTGPFTLPSDFASLVAVEAIGAGANGTAAAFNIFTFQPSNGVGGGGGAYANITSLDGIGPGSTLYCQIGAASGSGGAADTWVNKAGNTAPTATDQGVLAKGASGSRGGSSGSCIGTTRYDGGGGILARPGGSGAAGPDGPGRDGENSGAGGAGNRGYAGGGSGGISGAGGAGTYWTQTSNGATAGPGGGGAAGNPGGAGGAYGAGGGGGKYSGSTYGAGGAGTPGFIAFTYMAAA